MLGSSFLLVSGANQFEDVVGLLLSTTAEDRGADADGDCDNDEDFD